MKYFSCLKCEQIEAESRWLQENGNLKCIHCDALSREHLWPGVEARKLIEIILNCDPSIPEYGLIACVFLSSFIELLLEKILVTMILRDLLYEQAESLLDALLNTNQGRSNRLRLFNLLGHDTFSKEVKRIGHNKFMERWDSIVDRRNKIVHGDSRASEGVTAEMINAIVDESLEVFHLLHNSYNVESLAYKSANTNLEIVNGVVVDLTEEAEKDIEKLRSWNQGKAIT
ncbi:MAG: hypothetical protein HZC38_12670 [Chloroflexi bacterium]|nr:hypothetical protein [Chloroflexota bacterium]